MNVEKLRRGTQRECLQLTEGSVLARVSNIVVIAAAFGQDGL